MKDAGYVTASAAANAVGASQVGTIHRAVQSGRLLGARAGTYWYVSVAALLHEYREAPPIVARIKALGVKVNPEHEKQMRAAQKEALDRARKR